MNQSHRQFYLNQVHLVDRQLKAKNVLYKHQILQYHLGLYCDFPLEIE